MTPSAAGDRRLQLLTAYEARTDMLLSALALVFLVTYSVQMIVYEPGESWFTWATIFGNLLWLLFVADLIFRIGLSPNRWRFVRTHLLDVVTVTVPQLRALRALRAFNSDPVEEERCRHRQGCRKRNIDHSSRRMGGQLDGARRRTRCGRGRDQHLR